MDDLHVAGPPGRVRRRHLLRTAAQVGASGLIIVPGTIIAVRDALASRTGASGFAGQALDLATGLPLAGARVVAAPTGATTTTDSGGWYVLSVPPGTYSVEVSRKGYTGVKRVGQVIDAGYVSLDLDLIPEAPTPEQLQAIYERSVKQTAAPLVDPGALAAPRLATQSFTLPSTITVYYDRASPPYKINVPIEDYVKGVVPNEVPWSWPNATLQAQAVAARSYAAASQLTNGYVYPDTRSQMYDPGQQTDVTNAAVDATAGQVMTYNGRIVWAFFFSCCNGATTRNSEDALRQVSQPSGVYGCQLSGWNYVAYCRAQPCGGHYPSPSSDCGYWGHGVGMCQWGAYAHGNASWTYQQILNSYYTDVSLTPTTSPQVPPTPTPSPTPTPPPLQTLGPYLAQLGTDVTLRWSGDPAYPSEVTVYSGGTAVFSQGVAAQTFSLLVPNVYLPSTGVYKWVVAQTSLNTSAWGTLEIVPKVYQEYLPQVGN